MAQRARELRLARYGAIQRAHERSRFEETQWFRDTPNVGEPLAEANVSTISVRNADVLHVAEELVFAHKNEKVAILNLASQFRPGGGVAKGSLAQEESLFLRTDLCAFLDSKEYILRDKVGYSAGVSVVALDLESRLKNAAKPLFHVDVITAAALKEPKCANKWTEFARPEDKAFTQTLVTRILAVAALQKVDHLVLGALGCGAYSNPVEAIVACFQKAIFEHNLGKWFKTITFAIQERDGKKDALGPLGTTFHATLVQK